MCLLEKIQQKNKCICVQDYKNKKESHLNKFEVYF